uniref:ORF 1 protein n=2 Tax=Mardivirus TaxID=180252 RepID=Q89724_9ALPH|nr:orf1; putative [Meleagrid alphaherpesvirus 1]CAA86493.1 ORF 1 [Gallid alphaherpesvirus 2]
MSEPVLTRILGRDVDSSVGKQDPDPDRTILLSGAVLFPDQIGKVGREAKYIASIGSAPAERSTVVLLTHSDSCNHSPPTLFNPAKDSNNRLKQQLKPPIPSAAWYPEIRCNSGDFSTPTTSMSSMGDRKRWSLMETMTTDVIILRCIRIKETDCTLSNVISFQRKTGLRDEIITVTPLRECSDSEELETLRSRYGPNLYTIILLGKGKIPIVRTVVSEPTGSILWLHADMWQKLCKVIQFIRNTTDENFAPSGTYITTFWEQIADGAKREFGIGTVYAGACENIDSMLAETLMYDSLCAAIEHNSPSFDVQHNICFKVMPEQQLKVSEQMNIPRNGQHSRVEYTDKYSTVVSPSRFSILKNQTTPCYRQTRQTITRLYKGKTMGVSDRTVRALGCHKYNSDGCDCDKDHTYVSQLSVWLVRELKWAIERYCIHSDAGSSEKIRIWLMAFDGLINIECTSEHKFPPIAFFTRTELGWLHRHHTRKKDAWLSSQRDLMVNDLDLQSERVVARSSMPSLYVTTCGDALAIQPLIIRKRWKTSVGRDNERLLLETQKKLRDLDDGKTGGGSAQEFCFMVFIGPSMSLVIRRFFSADWSTAGKYIRHKFRKTATATVQKITSPPESSNPNMAFMFCVAIAASDRKCGRITCVDTLFSIGGAARDVDSLSDSINMLLGLCDLMAMSGICRLLTIESIPELGTVPYRFVLQSADINNTQSASRVMRCGDFGAFPFWS